MAKFEIGDRVRVIRVQDVLPVQVNDKGTVTDITPIGCTVSFDNSGLMSGLNENDLELVEEKA